MQKMLFIVNPHAGRGEMRDYLMDCLEIFGKAGYETTVYLTQGARDAERMVQENAYRFDRIVCAGGDGTLDEVVNGMMQISGEKKIIGYIPAGTTNDFAHSLHIPFHAEDAAEVIVHGKVFALDIGRFNDRYFTYIAAFGAFTGVSYSTPQPYKNLLGHAAYVLEGIRTLPSIKAVHAVVTTDQNERVEGDFVYGMVTNATTIGGVLNVSAEEVQMDDGLFEVLLIRQPGNPLQLQGIINLLLAQNMDSNQICHFKAASIHIEMDEAANWTLDGEFGGRVQSIQIQNCHQVLPLMIPAKPDPLY